MLPSSESFKMVDPLAIQNGLPTYDINPKIGSCFPHIISKRFSCCGKCIPDYIKERWVNFRRSCLRLVEHPHFETFIIASIIASSATLVSSLLKYI